MVSTSALKPYSRSPHSFDPFCRSTLEQQFYEATLARLPEASQAALEAQLLTEVALPEVGDADEEKEKEEDVGRQEGQAPKALQGRSLQAEITLHQLRMDPGWVGLATMLEEMAKLWRIRELALPDDLFSGIARHPSWPSIAIVPLSKNHRACEPIPRPNA